MVKQCPCGTWISKRNRSAGVKFCPKHSTKRPDRLYLNLFPNEFGREVQQATLTRTGLKNNGLLKHMNISSEGCPVWRLDMRPDIAIIRHASRRLRELSKRLSVEDHMAWVLLCHRMYDQPLVRDCVLPFISENQAVPKQFTMQNLKALRKRMTEFNEECALVVFNDKSKHEVFRKKQSNPSGSAAAHSGWTWLQDVMSTPATLKSFQTHAIDLAISVFHSEDGKYDAGHGMSRTGIDDALATIAKSKPLLHTGAYYTMSAARIAVHGVSLTSHHGDRADHPPCALTESAWKALLKPNAGARKNAKKYRLHSFHKASAFVMGMRRIHRNYCLCDLACHLCLAP